MYKKKFAAIAMVMALFSCAEKRQQKETPVTIMKTDTAIAQKDNFKEVVFDSKKDVVCGMPVTAGIADTTHYKGKVYGFCSAECKGEFLKSPAQYLAGK
jgi:YHS domain-containing protein